METFGAHRIDEEENQKKSFPPSSIVHSISLTRSPTAHFMGLIRVSTEAVPCRIWCISVS